jgi:hypothetical protein
MIGAIAIGTLLFAMAPKDGSDNLRRAWLLNNDELFAEIVAENRALIPNVIKTFLAILEKSKDPDELLRVSRFIGAMSDLNLVLSSYTYLLVDGVRVVTHGLVTLEVVDLPDQSNTGALPHMFEVRATCHTSRSVPTMIGFIRVGRQLWGYLSKGTDTESDCRDTVSRFRKKYKDFLKHGDNLREVKTVELIGSKNEGIGVAMYIEATREAGRRGAMLLGNCCGKDGYTSEDADRVWGSRRFAEAVDVDGWVAFAPPGGL